MITAEQAVVASVLMDAQVLRFAQEEVRGADFGARRLGAIFDGVCLMAASAEPIDILTVAARLLEWNVRGITDVDFFSWTSEVTPMNVAVYARQVHVMAGKRTLRDVATALMQSSEADDVAVGVQAGIEQLKEFQTTKTGTRIPLRMLGDVLAGDDDYEWAIPGLLETRDRLMLTGQEGGGKSYFIRQLAVLSAAGIHPTEFYPIRPVRTLVVDAENSEKQWRRAVRGLAAKTAKYGQVDPRAVVALECTTRLDLTRDSDLGQVHRWIDEHRPEVLFIGPLYRLVPRAINSDDEATPLLAALDTLRDRGVALVMEAHAGHSVGVGGERDLRPRGSAALLGWPEFGYGLRATKTEGTYQLVPWRGDRDERSWPKRMVRGSAWPWVPVDPFTGRPVPTDVARIRGGVTLDGTEAA